MGGIGSPHLSLRRDKPETEAKTSIKIELREFNSFPRLVTAAVTTIGHERSRTRLQFELKSSAGESPNPTADGLAAGSDLGNAGASRHD